MGSLSDVGQRRRRYASTRWSRVGLPTTRERDRATARFDDRQRGQRVHHMMHGREIRRACLVEAHRARARLALLDMVARIARRRQRNLA